MLENISDRPKIQPYDKQLLVCTGTRCAPESSEPLFKSLGEKLKAHGLAEGAARVKRTRCSCFAVCKKGPIVCVQPDGVWYCDVTAEVMDRIIVEHLKGGRPVEEHVFHRGPGAPGATTPAPSRAPDYAGLLKALCENGERILITKPEGVISEIRGRIECREKGDWINLETADCSCHIHLMRQEIASVEFIQRTKTDGHITRLVELRAADRRLLLRVYFPAAPASNAAEFDRLKEIHDKA
ncbi:MAG: hypothetical protein HKL90_03500 [Elusimicrobia bacterium]|nr:hypothetical protein [Elusimicrobiota bacterium]